MLSVLMLSVVMLSILMLSVLMLSILMLSILMLSVLMLRSITRHVMLLEGYNVNLPEARVLGVDDENGTGAIVKQG
jgi:hypothetical protein